MNKCLLLATIILGLAFNSAWGDDAIQAFSEGHRALQAGNFRQAMQYYGKAWQADNANQEYRNHYLLLRRVIKLRQLLQNQPAHRRWAQMAMSLRAFYHSHRIYSQALALDRQVHTKLGTAASAGYLAETMLLMEKNAEAAQLVIGLDQEKKTPANQVLLGIALARLGKIEAARQIARQLPPPAQAKPRMLFHQACLSALIGDRAGAMAALTRCFQLTPPSRLQTIKKQAGECQDLTALATSAAFLKIMQTRSQIPESSCSGGSSCSNCPMRGSCTGSSTQK